MVCLVPKVLSGSLANIFGVLGNLSVRAGMGVSERAPLVRRSEQRSPFRCTFPCCLSSHLSIAQCSVFK